MITPNRIQFLFLAATLLAAMPASAETFSGRVVGVSDGDTVTILDASNKQWKIRLMGIDAPEKRQAFGQKSKINLSGMAFDKHVTVEYRKKDKYGRTVGKILVDGIDANLEQIRKGLAWHYKKYENEQQEEDRLAYASAEDMAKAEKIGLWVEANPIPPWDWRKEQKRKD